LGDKFPDSWSTDDWFVRQRFEGCNASMVRIVRNLSELPSWIPGLELTAKVLDWKEGQVADETKKLQGLIADGQLYVVNYSNAFTNADGTPIQRTSSINQNYLPAPIALFQYAPVSKTLVPYAIQVESNASKYPGSNFIYFQDSNNGYMWRYSFSSPPFLYHAS
jgi:hypothetical protein